MTDKNEIKQWQNFLIGFFSSVLNKQSNIIADGVYGPITTSATKEFQKRVNLTESGVADQKTLLAAQDYGFALPEVLNESVSKPNGVGFLSPEEREKLFGKFVYKANPSDSNPEAIIITDGWDKKNLVQVKLAGMSHVIKSGVTFHKDAAVQLMGMFEELNSSGLTKHVLSWDGSFAPRFIRGSRTRLSNHAWGTAFDINAFYNPLGAKPAIRGNKGSVQELVGIANKHGFFWGGHFSNRPDGMHFEIGKKLT